MDKPKYFHNGFFTGPITLDCIVRPLITVVILLIALLASSYLEKFAVPDYLSIFVHDKGALYFCFATAISDNQ